MRAFNVLKRGVLSTDDFKQANKILNWSDARTVAIVFQNTRTVTLEKNMKNKFMKGKTGNSYANNVTKVSPTRMH